MNILGIRGEIKNEIGLMETTEVKKHTKFQYIFISASFERRNQGNSLSKLRWRYKIQFHRFRLLKQRVSLQSNATYFSNWLNHKLAAVENRLGIYKKAYLNDSVKYKQKSTIFY